MYLIKVDPKIMETLYYLREQRKANGDNKATIVGIVREALTEYLKPQKREVKRRVR